MPSHFSLSSSVGPCGKSIFQMSYKCKYNSTKGLRKNPPATCIDHDLQAADVILNSSLSRKESQLKLEGFVRALVVYARIGNSFGTDPDRAKYTCHGIGRGYKMTKGRRLGQRVLKGLLWIILFFFIFLILQRSTASV